MNIDIKDLLKVAADITDEIVYAIDMDTNQLLYCNNEGKKIFKDYIQNDKLKEMNSSFLSSGHSIFGQARKEILEDEDINKWQYYNPATEKYYILKSKEITYEEQRILIAVVNDITDIKTNNDALGRDLGVQIILNSCVELMHGKINPKDAIDEILKIIGSYYSSDRVQYFQINFEENTVGIFSEWCKSGISSEKETMQNIPIEMVSNLTSQLNKGKTLYIPNIQEILGHSNEGQQVLEDVGIAENVENSSALLITSIHDEKENVSGYLIIENVDEEFKEDQLLKPLSFFISDFIYKAELLESLSKLSFRDSLTGLKNRHSYKELLNRYEKFPPKALGVGYADISGLKIINDTFGHSKGDEIIIRMGQLLSSEFGEDVYRIGGDEFVILQEGDDIKKFESQISSLKKAIDKEEFLKASIGFSWSQEPESVTKQVEEADGSMYKEKQIKSADITGNGKYKTILKESLISEIYQGSFIVYLQPQINLKTNKISGAEALVRKVDSKGKIVPPNSFIPFYEKEGIIQTLDLFVFEEMCKFLNDIKKYESGKNLKLSINFSKITIAVDNIAKILKEKCAEYNIDPSRIVIEITETSHSIDINELIKTVEEFSKEGFYVSLDDFGSGYANLSMLTNLDFDEIKIDKSLVDGLENCEKSRTLTKMTIDVCNGLNKTISIAEGIETKEQYQILKDLLCENGQGYYFDKPMPIADFIAKYIST